MHVEHSAPQPEGEATLLLRALARGDARASDGLLELVYGELRRLASSFLRRERVGHTLQPTALVHEAWMRLVDQDQADWRDRAHFLGIAALAMRRVVCDHARARARDKRGAGAAREPLHTGLIDSDADLEGQLDVLALNEGLDQLAEHSARAAKVIELRFFGGLTEEEVARVLDVARPTVTRDWRAARAWLSNWMRRGETG